MTRGDLFWIIGGFIGSIVVGITLRDPIKNAPKIVASRTIAPIGNGVINRSATAIARQVEMDQPLDSSPGSTMDLTTSEIEALVMALDSIVTEVKEWESAHIERVDEFSSGDQVVWLCIPPLSDDLLVRARDEVIRYCSERNLDASASRVARRFEQIMGLDRGRTYLEVHANDRLGIPAVSVYTMPEDEELSLSDGILELRNIPTLTFSKDDPFLAARYGHLFRIVNE